LGFLEKLASSQENNKEDIEKREKKRKMSKFQALHGPCNL
jgi:hypothetical protein